MKKKFGFDLPRLKLGKDSKSKDLLGDGLDSPPVTPKSVRPPLSPRTDYDLRTACALVFQGYTSPARVDDEQYGNFHDAMSDMDFETIKLALDEDVEIEIPPLDPVNTRIPPARTNTEQDTSLDEVDLGDEEIERETAATIRVNGEEPFVTGIQCTKVTDSPTQLLSPAPSQAKTPVDAKVHKRSVSNPIQLHSLPTKSETMDRPRTAPRSDSMMTTGSTPQTDATEYGLAGSTAPTTAAITPAHASHRTSSHALAYGSANCSTAKFLTTDAEWMRQELEKHKKAQEQVRAQQELESQVLASLSFGVSKTDVEDTFEFTRASETIEAPAPVTKVPARKPVPRPGAESNKSATDQQKAESRPSGELRRSTSRKRRSAPRSESRHELEMLRPESREARALSREASRARKPSTGAQSSTQRNSTYFDAKQEIVASEPPSRSRSIARQLRSYIRPSSKSSSRNVSADISRPESRGRSVDSVRSAVSAISSIDGSTSRWRSWRPFNRNQDSTSTAETSRPDSSGSTTNGRTILSAVRQSPHRQKQKPPINLNRELPPLPSIDQWKPDEPEPELPTRPQHIVGLAEQRSNGVGVNGNEMPQPTSPRSQKPSVDSTASQRQRDSVLNDSHPQPRIHPKRISSLGAPINPSHNPHPPANFNSISLPTSPGFLTGTTEYDNLNGIAQDDLKPELIERIRDNVSSAQVPLERQLHSNNAHTFNDSRASDWPIRDSSAGRRVSQYGNTTMNANSANIDHSRTISDQQLHFSRKLSSDDYTRMYDSRFHNMVEIQPGQTGRGGAPPPVPPKDKPKKKWWQPNNGGKPKKRRTWMDQVVKSGSNSGVILTDGTVGAPIVRY